MCFDVTGVLSATNFDDGTVSTFDPHGRLLASGWAGPYTTEARDPESCVVDGAGDIYVGIVVQNEMVRGGLLRKYDAAGHLLATYHPDVEERGVDWIDLAADDCTLYYTSESNSIKRYNVCTHRQLPDFAHGLAGPCYALRIRPNGEVLVACYRLVYRLDPDGHVIQSYTARQGGERSRFFAVNLDPDGPSFWTAGLESGDSH